MKVSILTACHNNEKHIGQCAKSILTQDFSNLEWIVVDDKSDDNSPAILESIQDARLKIFKNSKQMFCSGTYAKALSYASGDICAIVDADDAIVPGAVKKIVSLYEKYPHLGYIYTQHWWCDVKLKRKRKGISALPPLSFLHSSKTLKHSFSHWRTFKTCLRKQACLFPEKLKYAIDKNLGFELERISYGGFYPEPIYLYRYYKGNMSCQHGRDQKRTWIDLSNKFIKSGSKTFPIIKIK